MKTELLAERGQKSSFSDSGQSCGLAVAQTTEIQVMAILELE